MQVGDSMCFAGRTFHVVYTHGNGGKVKQDPDNWDSPGFWIDAVSFERYRNGGEQMDRRIVAIYLMAPVKGVNQFRNDMGDDFLIRTDGFGDFRVTGTSAGQPLDLEIRNSNVVGIEYAAPAADQDGACAETDRNRTSDSTIGER